MKVCRFKIMILLMVLYVPLKSIGQKEDVVWPIYLIEHRYPSIYDSLLLFLNHSFDSTYIDIYHRGDHMDIFDSSISIHEAHTAICDNNGNLLFSVLYNKILNKDMEPMSTSPISDPLFDSMRLVRDNFVIKKPFSESEYLVISHVFKGSLDGIPKFGIFMAEVDMALNSGKGDVVNGSQQLLLDTMLFNQGPNGISFIKGECQEYWMVLNRYSLAEKKTKVFAYKIDIDGFHPTPIISEISHSEGPNIIYTISPNGTIVMTVDNKIQIASIDRSTGLIYNIKTVDTVEYVDSVMSPHICLLINNDRHLLVSSQWSHKVYSYDISFASEEVIRNSKELKHQLNNAEDIFDMRVAYDGCVYFSTQFASGTVRARILKIKDILNDPPIVDFNNLEVLFDMDGYIHALPNPNLLWHTKDIFNRKKAMVVCQDDDTVRLFGHPLAQQYEWSTGATSEYITGYPGQTYWVRSTVCDAIYYDTFVVQITPPTDRGIARDHPSDICSGAHITLRASGGQGGDYMWTDGTGNELGRLDSLQTGIYYPSTIYLQETNVYGCQYTDSISFTTYPCCELMMPNSFTPNGDGLNDRYGIVAEADKQIEYFHIYNRYGQMVFKGNDGIDTWDGTIGGEPAPVGTYYYMIQYRCYGDDAQLYMQKGEITLLR